MQAVYNRIERFVVMVTPSNGVYHNFVLKQIEYTEYRCSAAERDSASTKKNIYILVIFRYNIVCNLLLFIYI